MTQMTKNPYFIPILIGIIIALIGVAVGSIVSKKEGKIQKGNTIITEIKEKGEFASILFGKDKYELSYNQLPEDSYEIISNLEPGDPWKGDGFWDKRIVMQGDASIAINSTNRQPAKIYLDFDTEKDFSNVNMIKFYINLSDPQSLESSTIKIGDDELKNYYYYGLSNLKSNWDVIGIPIEQMVKTSQDENFDLSKIKRIEIEAISRPQQSVVVNIDYLAISRNSDFINDWQTSHTDFLGLGKINSSILFAGKRTNSYEATLSQVPGLKDFAYEAKISPQTTGLSGLFFRGSYKSGRGYYFVVSGIGGSSWTLKKLGENGWEDLLKGEISNFTFEKDKFYWLRVITNGNKISLYFSLDGQDFTQLAEFTDDEFASGGVGVAVFSGYTYFDDFKVKK